jgi:hypothetical protein
VRAGASRYLNVIRPSNKFACFDFAGLIATHAGQSLLDVRIYTQGYPSNSHTNIFGHITTYEDSTVEDPEMAVAQWFLIATAINKFSLAGILVTKPAARDS